MEVQKRLMPEDNRVISVGLFVHSEDEEVWDGTNEGTLSKTKEMLDGMRAKFSIYEYYLTDMLHKTYNGVACWR
jgi:hypothetical protein